MGNGNCRRRRTQAERDAGGGGGGAPPPLAAPLAAPPPLAEWELLPEQEELEEGEAQAAPPWVAALDALTSVRRLPSRRRPGHAPPSSQDAALSALRYRYGCRWHYLHALRVQASQMGPEQPAVKFAFLAIRCLYKQAHRQDMHLLNYLKQLRQDAAEAA